MQCGERLAKSWSLATSHAVIQIYVRFHVSWWIPRCDVCEALAVHFLDEILRFVGVRKPGRLRSHSTLYWNKDWQLQTPPGHAWTRLVSCRKEIRWQIWKSKKSPDFDPWSSKDIGQRAFVQSVLHTTHPCITTALCYVLYSWYHLPSTIRLRPRVANSLNQLYS